jgi:radical SAM superfamily enzyme YgiQ (UPF0313 family)
MSGQQIKYAIEFARYVRLQAPFVPIVWGGVQPTLLPEQTANNEYVDIVVRGEGDVIIKELSNALSEDQPIETVLGLTYKVNETVKSTSDGKVIDLGSIPFNLPYDLLPLDRYPSFRAGRFHIQTSRGCPHKCSFCYNSHLNHSRWRGKSPNRVIDEIQWSYRNYLYKIHRTVDDNFFVDKYRVRQICQGLLDRKLRVQWRANCRFDYSARYGSDFLALLEKSGCVELDFGRESCSERLQMLICRDATADELL